MTRIRRTLATRTTLKRLRALAVGELIWLTWDGRRELDEKFDDTRIRALWFSHDNGNTSYEPISLSPNTWRDNIASKTIPEDEQARLRALLALAPEQIGDLTGG